MATERLEDGSGLELLGQISKKWPSVLRIFAADRQRLQLLRGRLGPFELFQTLSYPIDPQKLLATLEMAVAAQQGESQQIEVTDEAPPSAEEPAPEAAEPVDPLELEQSDEFSEPRFARAGRARPMQVTSAGGRSSAGRSAPARSAAPAPRSRPAPVVSAPPAAPAARRSRTRTEPNQGNDLASKFPGSGTIGPRRSTAGSSPAASGGPSRSPRARPAAANKAPPVRFPPLERTPPLERIPPLEPPGARGGDFSEAAAMARAARSNYEASGEEFDTKRLATMIGGGVAVAAVVVILGFKMFGSKSEAPKPAATPVVTHAPEYPPGVTDLVAQTEAAFKADDFKTARADVDKLRQLAPSHPRLDFFEGLLTAKGTGASNGRGSKKKGSASTGTAGSGAGGAGGGSRSAGSTAGDVSHQTAVGGAGTTVGSGTNAAVVNGGAFGTGAAASASGAGSRGADGTLPPETPVGLTRTSPESAGGTNTASTSAGPGSPPPTAAGPGSPLSTVAATGSPPPTAAGPGSPLSIGAAAGSPAPTAAGSGSQLSTAAAAGSPAPTAAGPAAATGASAAQPAQATPAAPPSARRSSGEPPPVVQEAKLVRRVTPDYPSAAKKDGISGFVDLDVTVSNQGIVEDVSVTQSTPPDMFDKSAVAAVRKWKYDPRFVDGLPSQAHLKVHLDFGPNK